MKPRKKPWPTKAVMNQIYDLKLWGGKEFDFYSGEGSHHPKIIKPYLEQLISFLKSHNNNLIICDLGCGDFNIGKHLIKHSKKYIAIDIADDLINRNKNLFREKNLEFECLDISKDNLPPADCIILRQVLQHLSNAEIKRIVEKLADYKYVILTEHLPLGPFTPNKDIISGQGNRIKLSSGVNLIKPPFNFKYKTETTLDSHILKNSEQQIITKLFEVHY